MLAMGNLTVYFKIANNLPNVLAVLSIFLLLVYLCLFFFN